MPVHYIYPPVTHIGSVAQCLVTPWVPVRSFIGLHEKEIELLIYIESVNMTFWWIGVIGQAPDCVVAVDISPPSYRLGTDPSEDRGQFRTRGSFIL